jgi:sugar lactone lactonase YvrE
MNRRHLLLVPILCISLFLPADDLHESVIRTIAGSAGENILGTEFSFGGLAGLATDTSGNIFFTIQPLNKVYRLGIDGRVGLYAGNGIRGEHRDGVLATDSPLLNPSSLAADSFGNLYIAVARALLRVDAGTGVISTVFTTPYRPSGASIGISGVGPMAIGPTGLLYICDGSRIKSYSHESGSVAVVAGNGAIGATRPGVAATATPLKYPHSIAVGGDGTVYFSTLEHAVYRVGPKGLLELIPLKLSSEDRQLDDYDNAHAIALDAVGHLFVAQGNRSRVLRIDLKSGAVTAYGGTGKQGFNRDWIDARSANITIPTYLGTDSDGNLVVGEQYRIRRIDVSDGVIATVVGNGLPGSTDSGTTEDHGKLWEPANVVAASDGSVYITSSFSQRVSRLNSDGSLVTLAGGGDPVRFAEPGPALEVSLNYPQGLWISESGELYFSDNDNRIVRHLERGWIDNFATTPKHTNSAGIFLYYAAALVANESYFYMSDPNGHTVWRISRADGRVEAYAGIGSNAEGQSEEDVLSHKLVNPSGLALDASGNLFIADGAMDGNTGRILRVDAVTRETTLVLSHLRQPSGLAFQSANTLCFSESGGNQVRCLDLANHSVHLVAGTGVAGFSGDGGPAECARLSRPSGISFDALGRLYIADTGNQRIRVVRLGERVASCH